MSGEIFGSLNSCATNELEHWSGLDVLVWVFFVGGQLLCFFFLSWNIIGLIYADNLIFSRKKCCQIRFD